ncbi:hypothetical protein BDW62DRAFT_205948 [Aspergillus aurantiobrunneus]
MPEVPDPKQKEGFMERMFQRRPSQAEAGKEADQTLERPLSQDETRPSTQRRNSTLQRLREYMHSEEELDEAGKTYAKLM